MSFLARIFGTALRHALNQRSGRANKALDPEGWQVGGWAECVVFPDWQTVDGQRSPGPRHGQVMRVTGVRSHPLGSRRELALGFASWPRHDFEATAFRKLNPRADEATAAEAEFTALVKRTPQPALAPKLPGENIEEHQ